MLRVIFKIKEHAGHAEGPAILCRNTPFYDELLQRMDETPAGEDIIKHVHEICFHGFLKDGRRPAPALSRWRQDSDAEQLLPQVKPAIALALHGVRFFCNTVAMCQAAHNCDYYITKYPGKSKENILEQRKMHIDTLVANGDERVPPDHKKAVDG